MGKKRFGPSREQQNNSSQSAQHPAYNAQFAKIKDDVPGSVAMETWHLHGVLLLIMRKNLSIFCQAVRSIF